MINYIKNDTRQFIIKPNPLMKSKFKVIKESVKRDASGKPVKRSNGEGLQTVEAEMNDLVVMPGVKHIFTPARRPDNHRLLTGLDVEVDNPYDKEEFYINEQFEKALKGRTKVKLQHLLEFEHEVNFNYYSSDCPEGLISKTDPNKKFFQTSNRFVYLDNGVKYLNMSNPNDRVMYYALTARHKDIQPTVALNYEELLNSSNARFCKWYFVDEEEKQNMKVSSLQQRNKVIAAIENLAESKKKNSIIDIIKALEFDEARDESITPERAYILLNEYTKDNKTAEAFMSYYEIWKDKVRQPEIEAFAELYDMIRHDIIRVKNGKYEVILKDKSGNIEIKLFNTKNQIAKEFLMDPAYKEYTEELRSTLKAKRM